MTVPTETAATHTTVRRRSSSRCATSGISAPATASGTSRSPRFSTAMISWSGARRGSVTDVPVRALELTRGSGRQMLTLRRCELVRRELRDFAERLPEFLVGPADRAADLRQPFRAEDQQRDERNDDQLCPVYSHGLSSGVRCFLLESCTDGPVEIFPRGQTSRRE